MRSAPIKARFFMKLICSPIRCVGSDTFQNACMINEVGTRNRIRSTDDSAMKNPKNDSIFPVESKTTIIDVEFHDVSDK